MSPRIIRETVPFAEFTGSWRDALTVPAVTPTWRVWLAGPDGIETFDSQTSIWYAPSTRHHLNQYGEQVVSPVPGRIVFTDLHGREHTVYPDDPQQPCEIVQPMTDRPSDSWLRAVQRWRFRRECYPDEPERWLT